MEGKIFLIFGANLGVENNDLQNASLLVRFDVFDNESSRFSKC